MTHNGVPRSSRSRRPTAAARSTRRWADMTAGIAVTHQRRYSIGSVAQLVHTHRWKHSCEITIVPIPVIAHFRELRIAPTCTSASRAPTARPTKVVRMCARAPADDWSTAATISSPTEDTSETAATQRRPRDIDAIVTTFIRSISIHSRGKSVCGDPLFRQFGTVVYTSARRGAEPRFKSSTNRLPAQP